MVPARALDLSLKSREDCARAEALADFLDGWEAEHGSLTPGELSKATAELGLPGGSSAEPAA